MQNKHGKLTVKDFLTSKRYYAIPSEFRYFNSYHDLAGHIYVAHNVVEKNMIQTMSPQLNLSINYSHLEKLAQVCLMGLVWHLKDPNSESIC